MRDRLNKLISERANTVNEMQVVNEDAAERDFTSEEVEKWDRMKADVVDYDGKIAQLRERIETGGDLFVELEKETARQIEERQDRKPPFTGDPGVPDGGGPAGMWTPPAAQRMQAVETDTYRSSFNEWIYRGPEEMETESARELRAGNNMTLRALGEATGSAGGYLVPPGFRNELIERMKFYGGMIDNGTEIVTATGNDLPYPTVDDTSNKGSILNEGSTISESDVAFGLKTLEAYTYTSGLVQCSVQLLNDSVIDIDSFLPRALGVRLARILNDHYTTGTDVSQPQGIITALAGTTVVNSVVTAASTNAVAYNDLTAGIDAVDYAYQGPGCKWMMHQNTVMQVRNIKDSNQRPLWEFSMQAGTPPTLFGYPVVVNNSMDKVGASKNIIVFGNIEEAYVKRTVQGVQLVRLVERYMDLLTVGFFCFLRTDGMVQNTAAVSLIQNHS